MFKRLSCLILCLVLLIGAFPARAETEGVYTLLFTSDMHDYYYPRETVDADGQTHETGGLGRLMTLIKENTDENTLYVDCGDFSMGTLYQSIYSTDAFELRALGMCGCMAVTLGNHEFDYGAKGLAAMLRAAKASGDPLPELLQANLTLPDDMTEEQADLKAAMEEYGLREYTIKEVGGLRVGIFAVMGYDSIECVQSDVKFTDYIETAKRVTEELKQEGVDLIVALSHTGVSASGSGEDAELAEAVPDIDIIVSGHAHTLLTEPLYIGDTVIVSCGEYLEHVGRLRFTLDNGMMCVTDYTLLQPDESVPEDPEAAAYADECMDIINETYLAGSGVSFDTVICRSDFDTITLSEMYATHQEYTTGDLIADSYMYAARQAGIDDIDCALVGLGTIRGSIKQGDITCADAFEICSLGVGSDGSAGHPIMTAWITGRELKLMCELDASLGPMVSSIKMSYSGLKYTFNTERTILDRVTEVYLVRPDGTQEKISNSKMYRVAANLYALNMLGMLNGLTKGVLSITPKYPDGTVVTDMYDIAMKDQNGREIKEWEAFRDYLMSFEKDEDGISVLPEMYSEPLGRKNKVSEDGIAKISHPGTATPLIPKLIAIAVIVFAGIITADVFIVKAIVKKAKKRAGLHTKK